MKTTDTAFKTAVHAETFDDIIFDGRNHEIWCLFSPENLHKQSEPLTACNTLCCSFILIFAVLAFQTPATVEIPKLSPTTGTFTSVDMIPVILPPSVNDLPKEAKGTAAAGPMVIVEEVTGKEQPSHPGGTPG